MSVSNGIRTAGAALTLATLIFFPLINGLASNPSSLHWRAQDTVETLMAWLLLAAAIAATLALAALGGRVRRAEALTAAWLGAALFFFAGALVRVQWWSGFVNWSRDRAPVIVAVVLGAGTLLMLRLIADPGRAARRPLQRATLMLSPLVAVALFQIGSAELEAVRAPASAGAAASALPEAGPRTVVLLFDELSADLIYGASPVDPAALPALARFAAEARIEAGAYLPGGQTDLAIPALFTGTAVTRSGERKAPADSLIERLNAGGGDFRLWGWHVDVCTLFGARATRCRAVSAYNPRTLDDGFSLVHPFWTDLNLLPSLPPFGALKVGPAVRFHEETLAGAQAWLSAQLADPASRFVFVHVNVPHVPYLGDDSLFANGRDRFVMTAERYGRQLRYVDRFLATAMQAVDHGARGGDTRMVVMSDHNARALTPLRDHSHVVFMVRDGRRLRHSRVETPAHAGDLLSALVDSATAR